MYAAVFTIPLTSMAADEILGLDRAFLRIPYQINIDIMSLTRDAKMSDVEKALDLLKNSPPEFPTKLISIRGGFDLQSLNAALKSQAKKGNKKWILNIVKRKLTVPSDTNEEEVKKSINKFKLLGKDGENEEEDEEEFTYLGDIGYCEDEEQSSTRFVNVYKLDGTVQTKNFCRLCVRDSLIYLLGKMFDDDNYTPIMNRIYENTNFIGPITLFCSPDGKIIPIGQLLWSFIADSHIAMPARTYITALALQTLNKFPCITCCPQHPSILFRRPPLNSQLKCIISGCKYLLCPDCNKWHEFGTCPEKTPVPLGCRVCPSCHAIIEKSQACNHLACNCGKHFCYYCGAGPWDSSTPCYDHLSKEHKDCFNDQPDYLKFIKHNTSITDQQLEAFYNKYPQLRNLKV